VARSCEPLSWADAQFGCILAARILLSWFQPSPRVADLPSEVPRNRSPQRERRSPCLRWGAWLPLASLIGVAFYARRFDGWGGWATAPLFLLPVFLSVVLLVIGASEIRDERAAGRIQLGTLAACALGAIPLLWFLLRVVRSG
jgi:hypothetical protein